MAYVLLFILIFLIIKGVRAIIYKIDTNSTNIWHFGVKAQLIGLVTVALGGFGLYIVNKMFALNLTYSLITLVLAICLSAIYWYSTPIKNLRSRKDVDAYTKKLYNRNLFSKDWIASGDWIQILLGIILILGVLYMMFS